MAVKPIKPLPARRNVPMTPERKAAFIQALKDNFGLVALAAKAASPHSKGDCETSFRDARRDDPEFAAAWEAAQREAISMAIHAALTRGQKGIVKNVYQGGVQVMESYVDEDGETKERPATEIVYSDRLLEQALKALKGIDLYSFIERKEIALSGSVTHDTAANDGRVYLKPQVLAALPHDIKIKMKECLDVYDSIESSSQANNFARITAEDAEYVEVDERALIEGGQDEDAI